MNRKSEKSGSYQKPQIRKVALRPQEALVTGCKLYATGSSACQNNKNTCSNVAQGT